MSEINSEIPVLRKEELITILEALFKLSQEPNNAFLRKEDGLYVLDFYQAFQDHINNSNIHTTRENLDILKDFSIVDDILNYKGAPIIVKVSEDDNNAIQVRPDGLFLANDFTDVLREHINDSNVHVTPEQKEVWDNILELAKAYVEQLLQALTIYDFELVAELPVDTNTIRHNVIYCLEQTILDSQEKYYVRYIYRNNKWIPFDITNNTYQKFARQQDLEANYAKKTDGTVHNHNNKSILDKFTEDENHNLLYDNNNILEALQISDDPNNAIFIGSDNKFYVKDLSSELASIAKEASLSKVILLNQDCNEAGIYELEEEIDEFNFLMIHYYLMPDDPELQPYDAKTEMLDVDILNELYEKHIDYILEHDYGISTYNTKIRFYENKMQITYYNHVCIYKIIGVR